MVEFGSSPCLLDELASNPTLAERFEADIQELQTRDPGEKRYEGDLCKIGDIIHVYRDGLWCPLNEAMSAKFVV